MNPLRLNAVDRNIGGIVGAASGDRHGVESYSSSRRHYSPGGPSSRHSGPQVHTGERTVTARQPKGRRKSRSVGLELENREQDVDESGELRVESLRHGAIGLRRGSASRLRSAGPTVRTSRSILPTVRLRQQEIFKCGHPITNMGLPVCAEVGHRCGNCQTLSRL
ncbi:unnamed protein product [Protopolystoma xenopodis]|uniref:Uncharacterized protein n=1 Tax=Protopolystoma xenopodis TaxID=117903 RepID=A0A3S5CU04_9PLAT|nr:unnamed protein product [Protopolystoma xenopodis]